MKEKSVKNNISAESLAAFLDGNATSEESLAILESISEDSELRELLNISDKVDSYVSEYESMDFLPMTLKAANCNGSNLCCIECEKFILRKRNIDFDESKLLNNAIKNKWLQEDGTALYNIGRNLETLGLVVTRQYKCGVTDIVNALNNGDDVIVAVDGGELVGDLNSEIIEDNVVGYIPDHVVIVLECDVKSGTVAVFDPGSVNDKDVYPIEQFVDAWNDSKNYLLTINFKDMKKYVPKPIDLTDVVLTEDLTDLREAIAENAHEIWAENRQTEGWTYGPMRNDELKQTPDMVPYSMLPDSEKEYDRQMAMRTIKLLKKLGYDLIKREDTELYKILKQRIIDSKYEYHCRRCGNVIYKHQIFCDKCGLELKMDWKDK